MSARARRSRQLGALVLPLLGTTLAGPAAPPAHAAVPTVTRVAPAAVVRGTG